MLKIGKLKKKKGKKNKGEDLFDPEQLAKYKKELEEKKAAAAAEAEASGQGQGSAGQTDDEWRKFQLLTGGVDDIVKKASEGLDRIKETSYFQRNTKTNSQFASEHEACPSVIQEAKEYPHQEGSNQDQVTDASAEGAECEGAAEHTDEPQVPEEPPEIEAVVVDDSLFDTSYLEAIELGEIKLAYIPDSPTEDAGDDPFDTSAVADVVKRIEEEEKRKARQVNLCAAVDVLTKKVEKITKQVSITGSKKKVRPRPHAVNLIGEFDNPESLSYLPPSKDAPVANKNDLLAKLDNNQEELGAEPLELCPVSQAPIVTVAAKSSSKENLKDLLSEFDVINELGDGENTTDFGLPLNLNQEEEVDEDDEFVALAAESLHKDHKEEEEDPFDTTFVDKVAPPGKSELKILANEFLEGGTTREDDDDDFNPRAGEPVIEVKVPEPPKNLLDSHDSDLCSVKAAVILPTEKFTSDPTEESIPEDPFDTSTIETVLPGRIELKLLEHELLATEVAPLAPPALHPVLASVVAKEAEEELNFNPRENESPPPHPLDKPEDHFTTETVLIPQQESIELDPFDTSIVGDILPGKVELQLLERELTADLPRVPVDPFVISPDEPFAPQLNHRRESDDFNPRCNEDTTAQPTVLVQTQPLTHDEIFANTTDSAIEKPLTPTLAGDSSVTIIKIKSDPSEFIDPFDTSDIVIDTFGKTELKDLESELLSTTVDVTPARPLPQVIIPQAAPKKAPPSRPPQPHLFETTDELAGDHSVKVLTPVDLTSFNGDRTFDDPFDTSIADGLVPTKVEIQVLEKELGVEAGIARSISDDDFNPRQYKHPASELPCSWRTLVPTTATPINVSDDPFDTSSADTIVPGKAELKLLEAELL